MPCHACLYSGIHTLLAYYIYILYDYMHTYVQYMNNIYYNIYTLYLLVIHIYIYIHNTCANLCFYLHLKPRYDSLQGIPLSVGSWFGGPRLLIDVEPQSVQGEPRL